MTIFINPTASTNGTGSVLNPKNTPVGIDFASDDEFAFCAGTTFDANMALSGVSLNASGTASARKKLRSYEPQTGNPTTSKAHITNVERYGIYFSSPGIAYWDVEDLEVTQVGNGGSDFCWGVLNFMDPPNDYAPAYLRFKRCEIHDLRPGAVDCGGMSLRGTHNVVEDSHIYDIPTDAMRVDGLYLTVRNCVIEKINQDGRNQADCIQTGSDAGGLLIEDCYLDASDVKGKQCIILQNTVASTIPQRIRNNTLIGPKDELQIIIADQTVPLIVSGNKFVNGKFGCRVRGGARIFGNVFVNTKTEGQYFAVWLEVDGQYACNNTIINYVPTPDPSSTQVGIYAEVNHVNHVIRNNVLVGLGSGLRIDTVNGQTESNNVFSSTCVNPVITAGNVPAALAGTSKVVADIEQYMRPSGSLIVEGALADHPLALYGAYLPGVHLRNGRARPGRFPAGAYQAF